MFLGIDVGTSGVKAVILGDDGRVLDSASAPLDVQTPAPLWSEQDPDQWWASTGGAIRKLSPKLREAVMAIGLSGQMHGATLLGKDDRPLRPAILWNDGRSSAECAALQTREPRFLTLGGNLVMPGFTAPKLEWVRRHEPDVFAATTKVLLPKDYVRLRMTGGYASDMSDSAGTLWLDVAERDWSDPLLDACGLETHQMPELFEGTAAAGELRAEVASDWGMSRVPVCAGGGDNAASAVGSGVTQPGEALMSLGTSGVIFVATDTFRSNPDSGVHAFCHALPDRWHVMSVMLSAASCLDWGAKLTGCDGVDAFVALAESSPLSASTPLFLPYLSGERTPHNDPNAKGAFFGLTHATGPADLARSVLEGVAMGMADGLGAISQADISVDSLSVVGGGSRSRFWGQILASALQRPLDYREGADVGAALGAARLAAISLSPGAQDAWSVPPELLFSVASDADMADMYSQRRAQVSSLYHATQPISEGGYRAR
ncbi:MAG: xylulokinase [Pseudomonadota bacterium]